MNFAGVFRRKHFGRAVCAVFLFLFFALSVASAETILNYEVTVIHTEAAGSKGKPEKKVSEKQVVFGGNFFAVKDAGQERVYDFNARRIHYLNHRGKTRTEIALFADLSFRIAELQGRIFMADEVQRGGGKLPYNLYTLESLFGLEGEKPSVKLNEETNQDGGIVLSDAHGVIAEIIPGKETPETSGMFERFLIYDNSLHPLVRRRILAEKQIPSEFRYILEGIDSKDEFIVRLKSFETIPGKGMQIPENYQASPERPGAAEGSEAVDGLIQGVREKKSTELLKPKSWFWEQAQAALDRKDFLNAAVYYLEYGLQSGDQASVSEAMVNVAPHQNEDENLDRFLRSLGIAGEEQARRAVEELLKLDRKQVDRAHMIDLAIANQKVVLGEFEAAREGYMRTLNANPYLAGAYKDLGDLFYRRIDMATAWVCWDFARELVSGHFMLAPISDHEKELMKTYPEFF